MKGVDCLTTVAATSIMSIGYATALGNDRTGLEFMAQGAEMAKRLCLYNVPADAPQSTLDAGYDDSTIAAAAIAWGAFNYQT